MIRVDRGRASTSRTLDELEALASDAWANLTPDEVKAASAILAEMGVGSDVLLELMYGSHWERRPVTMRQFLEDEYYMGIPGASLYPKIRDDLCKMFDDSNYSEVVLAGSIGWGKSTAAAFIVARVMYEISCLRDPQRSFGLSPGSEIHFALISKSLEQTNKVLRNKLSEPMRLSPYFQEHFMWEDKPWEMKFPRNVVVFVASIASTDRILGSNLFGAAVDEVNFLGAHSAAKLDTVEGRKGLAAYDKADRLYHNLVRRMKSRFSQTGVLPGKTILISSKTVKNSFTERRVAEAKGDPTVFVMDYATWDVKPQSQFSKKKFSVLVGGANARSRILSDGEAVDQRFLDETNSYVVSIPEEFRADFDVDLSGALRDVAGISVEAISQFITRQESIFSAVDPARIHPFSQTEWVYGTPADFMWPKLCTLHERTLPSGHKERYWQPRLNPKAHRHVHIDVALSGDSIGIAMGHVSRHKAVLRRDPSGESFSDTAPEYEIDFMLRIRPPQGEQIFLPDVRAMVYALMDHGFQVNSFSCDSFQSAEMLQQMRTRGVSSEVISVDRTTEAYLELRQALYEARVRVYDYAPFIQEAITLEYDGHKGKVDHPIGGSKDVTDAVAGVMAGLRHFASRAPVPMLTGYDREVQDDDLSWVVGGASRPVTPGSDDVRLPLPFLSG
jgi:hypothetical protein